MNLNESQLQALNEMRENFSDQFIEGKVSSKIPLTSTFSDELLAQSTQTFAVDDGCLLRYLRARNFDVAKATTLLRNTIEWRTTFQVEEAFTSWWDIVEKECCTGKMYTRGFDKEGHAILYMKPGKENSTHHDGNIKFLVFSMEAAIRGMVEDGRQGNSHASIYYLI